MLESHSMQPRLEGMWGSSVCLWPQLSNRFDQSSRLKSIQDTVGNWTTRAACRLVITGKALTPAEPRTLRHQQGTFLLHTRARARDHQGFSRTNEVQ